MPKTTISCDYEWSFGATQAPYTVLTENVDTSCENDAGFIVYQPEDDEMYDGGGFNSSTLFVCKEHIALMVNEMKADGLAPDQAVFVIEIASIDQVN